MNGFLNVLKPPGVSSAKVVASLKRLVYPEKIGHLGTLDPLAAGVLPIAVGKAARLFDYFLTKRKRYLAYFTFGTETDTLDSAGKIVKTAPAEVTRELLAAVAEGMVGEQMQLPPDYSAVSVNGRRAYDLARSGKEVVLKKKPVTIFAFDVLRQSGERTWLVDLTVSGGTYIRSIVRDAAKSLGTVGYMSGLLRTESGCFKLEDAATLSEIGRDAGSFLIPPQAALAGAPRFTLPDAYYKDLSNGVKLYPECTPEAPFTVYCGGELFGLGVLSGDGRLEITAYLK